MERPAGLLGDGNVGRSGRHDRHVARDRAIRLSDLENQRPRALVVVGVSGQGLAGKLFPLFLAEPRHEDVVLPRELPADRDDLVRELPGREHDFRKAEPALAIEVEREFGGRHRRHSNRCGARFSVPPHPSLSLEGEGGTSEQSEEGPGEGVSMLGTPW